MGVEADAWLVVAGNSCGVVLLGQEFEVEIAAAAAAAAAAADVVRGEVGATLISVAVVDGDEGIVVSVVAVETAAAVVDGETIRERLGSLMEPAAEMAAAAAT